MKVEIWKHKFEIKKGRWVHVPSKEMYLAGRKIHNFILKRWRPYFYYYHMRNGGHVLASKIHLENNYFALIDISNFFECTSQSRVTRELKTLLPYNKAREIAKLSTVRVPKSDPKKFSVPYGFPQSPILATLCLNNSYAGNLIETLRCEYNLTVSVYMDDIIISCNDYDLLCYCYERINFSLIKSNYSLNLAKSQQPSREIEVFNLRLSHNDLAVTSKRMVYFIKSYSESENDFEREGIAAYVRSVNSTQANKHFL